MRGWALPEPGEDVKDIIRRQRAGQPLSDRDYARLAQRTSAEDETERMGGVVRSGIRPKRLTPFELGARDRLAVEQDKKDLAEYSAGRGFPVKPAGPTAAQMAARQNGVGRASSGGFIERGGKLTVYAGQAAQNTDPNRAGSGGTITFRGETRRYGGTPAKAPVVEPAAPAPSAPKATEPLGGDAEEEDPMMASKKKVRRDVLAA